MKDKELSLLEIKVREHSYKLATQTLPNLRRKNKPATPFNYMKFYEQCETDEDAAERQVYEGMIEEEVLRKETIQKMLNTYFIGIFKGNYDESIEKLISQIKRTKTTEELFEKTATILKALIEVSNTQKALNNVSENTMSVKKFTSDINQDMGKLTDDIEGGIRAKRIEPRFGSNLGEKISETIVKSKKMEEEHLQKEGELLRILTLQQQNFEHSIEELEEKLRQTEKIIYTDALTGVYNRRALDERLVEELQKSRKEKLPCALAFIDVDFFKKVNDTFGHQIGDRALRHVAQTITDSIKNSDFIARYGGEEFAVIFPNTTYANALLAAENIRSNVEASEVTVRGTPLKMTISIGVSEVLVHQAKTPNDIMELADKALYKGKKTGRNKVC